MQIELKGRVAVITGGSRGIGAATVKLFAAAGSRVVFSYHRAARAAGELARSCERGKAVAVQADVARMADCRRLVATAVRRFGRIDILVANAGIWPADPAPIEKMSEREWDQMMAVNLKGVYGVVRQVVPHMIECKQGRIIVISSTAGQRGEAFHTHYGASKGALISFVKGLAAELARHRILVNCCAPGWVDTDMSAPALDDPAQAREIKSTIPLGRPGRPGEIAMPILFLASEMASYITGEVLNVNGGNVLCG